MAFVRRKCTSFDIPTQDSRGERFPIHPSLSSLTRRYDGLCLWWGRTVRLPLDREREEQLVEGRKPGEWWGYIGRGLGRPRTALL